jgi:hypothetical protein
MVAKAIIFKFTEKMVSQAKSTWYGGGFRSQIVIYTVAKLVSMIQEKALGSLLDLQLIWARQCVSPILAKQLETIAKAVSSSITTPPIAGMNVGEWCKNEKCWVSVMRLELNLTTDLTSEFVSVKNVSAVDVATREQSVNDVKLNAVIEVVNLAKTGTWQQLNKWSQQYSPVFGKDADLVRNAMKANWIPSDSQAATLLKILKRMDAEGFQAK